MDDEDDDDQIKEKIQINNPKKKNYYSAFKDINIADIQSAKMNEYVDNF